jgi:hypothetical protein
MSKKHFFVYVRDTKKQVIKVFHHNEEGIIGNAKDMKKEILDIKNDACVEIPNFIPFWTMKYFKFQSWIVIYVFFVIIFLSFFTLGELAKFSILLMVANGNGLFGKNESKFGRKLI